MRSLPQINALTPHLWVAQSRLFATNSGIFIDNGQAALIDPALFPEEIDTLGGFATARSTRQAILMTHSHWDHILGPERLPGRDCFATAAFQKTLLTQRAGICSQIARFEAQNGLPRFGEITLPTLAVNFQKELHLLVGNQELQLWAAPGHSSDQCVIYHPESSCLWAGDMLSDLEIPFVAYNLTAYRASLDRLAGLKIQTLIPGHGTPTLEDFEIRARLDGDRAYLEALDKHVSAAVRTGCALKETLLQGKDIPFRQDAGSNAGPHGQNIASAYREMGGKNSNPDAGWKSFE